MTEILHAWALAPAAVGTCCLAARRRRVRAPELMASLVMLVAMLDAARPAPLLPPVWWASLLMIAAITLAAIRRSRSTVDGPEDRPPAGRSRGSDERSGAADATEARRMSVLTTLGMIAMAALLLAMTAAHPTGAAHAHGVTAGAFLALLVGGCGAYAIGSAVAAAKTSSWLDRTQYAAMGATTLVMGLALLV